MENRLKLRKTHERIKILVLRMVKVQKLIKETLEWYDNFESEEEELRSKRLRFKTPIEQFPWSPFGQ